jgi:RimJ/RimL family protein N-acetyltransferase
MEKTNLFTGWLVRLAAPVAEEAEQFALWTQDSQYLRQLDTDIARPLSAKEYTDRFLSSASDGKHFEFSLRTRKDDRLIGFVALHSIDWNNQTGVLSIGIGDPEFRGKGYGRDSLELILNYAFNELNLYRVGLDVIANNNRAIKAYERAGFRREGVIRQAVYRDGQRDDLILMGILRTEWQLKKKEEGFRMHKKDMDPLV